MPPSYYLVSFNRVGDNGDVRGLWFHDKTFMPKFVHSLYGICHELGISCEGTSGGDNNIPNPAPPPNPLSGKAILGMLKKYPDSSSTEFDKVLPSGSSYGASMPSATMNLLRKEFLQASDPQLVKPSNIQRPMDVLHAQMVGEFREWSQEETSLISHNFPESRTAGTRKICEDVKRVLVEMVSSDEFIFEFCSRLNLVNRN